MLPLLSVTRSTRPNKSPAMASLPPITLIILSATSITLLTTRRCRGLLTTDGLAEHTAKTYPSGVGRLA